MKDAVVNAVGILGGSRASSRRWSTASWAGAWVSSSARSPRAGERALAEAQAADRRLRLGGARMQEGARR